MEGRELKLKKRCWATTTTTITIQQITVKPKKTHNYNSNIETVVKPSHYSVRPLNYRLHLCHLKHNHAKKNQNLLKLQHHSINVLKV